MTSAVLKALAGGVALALAGCGGDAARPGGAPLRQGILVVLDATRGDRISGSGYARDTTPRLAALGREGLVFTRFFSNATYTREALSNLFYSRYFARPLIPGSGSIPLVDPEELFRTRDAEAISLPRALARAGIHTAGVSAHSWITEDSELAAEFDEFHDLSATVAYPHRYHHPRAEQVVDWVIDWLDHQADHDYFLYVHLMDTHFPHFLDEDARGYFDDPRYARTRFDDEGRPKDVSTPLTGSDRAYLDALYDGSLHYVDRHLGRLFDHLAARGRLETTMIAVTADHGEHLLEYPGRFEHSGPWYDALAHIPFVLYAPGRVPARRLDSLAELVDVAPTLLAVLGVDLPAEARFDGGNLLAVAREQQPAKGHVTMSHGVRTERWKALFLGASPLDSEDVSGELYDVTVDPGEVRNLWSERPEERTALIERFRATLRGPYERWRQSVNAETPRSAFAIAARSFRLPPDVVTVTGRPTIRAIADAAPPAGWARGKHTLRYGLVAREGASSITVEFPVPDGEYRVGVALRGACTISLAGGAQTQVVRSAAAGGADQVPSTLRDVESIDLGVVRIADQRFRATIEPLPGTPWLLVRSIGFEPTGLREAGPAVDREREERLRGLGYVE